MCCELRQMTFEHIPPKGAGNKVPVRLTPIEDWLARESPREVPQSGPIAQKGAGGYVLCGECNNRTGRYGREYQPWAADGMRLLQGLDRIAIRPPYVGVVGSDVYPGRFVRQALTMLVAVSGNTHTSASNPEIAPILLEGRRALPGDLRIFMSLYQGPGVRHLGVTAAMDLRRREPQVLMEVAYPPFAFVGLVSGEPTPELGAEITGWTEVGIDTSANVQLSLQVASGHTPFPADYRPLEQIEREAS